MSQNTPAAEQYEQFIEHEVRIRLHTKQFILQDEKFDKIEKRFDRLESKFESGFLMLVGLIITSIILPVVLHSLKLV